MIGQRILLLAACAFGASLAALGLGEGEDTRPALPNDAIAVVNGRAITTDEFQRAIDAVSADRREVIDAGLRERVLGRLIDEELLVQYGLASELAARDPRVRTDLSSAVIDLVVTRAEQDVDTSEAALRSFYTREAGRFATPLTVETDVLFFAGQSSERARSARRRLATGESVAADAPPFPPLEGPIVASKLRDYWGPEIARFVGVLEIGEWSAPLEVAGGHAIVRVRARRGGEAPTFETIRDVIERGVIREAGERGLREFLKAQRAAATIEIVEAAHL